MAWFGSLCCATVCAAMAVLAEAEVGGGKVEAAGGAVCTNRYVFSTTNMNMLA